MERAGVLGLPLALAIGVAACSSQSTGPSDAGAPPSGATAADLAFCVQDVNSYRARVGRPPYPESAALEAYAAAGAQQDATTNRPHAHFARGNGAGIALAENKVLNGAFGVTAQVDDAIRSANALFFSEGPGGGHYEHLVSPSLTEIGCGVDIADRRITEDFR